MTDQATKSLRINRTIHVRKADRIRFHADILRIMNRKENGGGDD